jgi:hypothetical protein
MAVTDPEPVNVTLDVGRDPIGPTLWLKRVAVGKLPYLLLRTTPGSA